MKFGRKEKKNEGKKGRKEVEEKKKKEEEKEEDLDTNAVKFAEVSRGAAQAKQKVKSAALWESETMVVKVLLFAVMTVFMYMIGGLENILRRKVLGLGSAREQDRNLPARDRHPSRKGLSKANGFRKRRHVRRRLALVGQVLKIMVFICMDTVHAMEHGPEPNPAAAATAAATNGPVSGSAEVPSADQVLAQVLRQNTEALQKHLLKQRGFPEPGVRLADLKEPRLLRGLRCFRSVLRIVETSILKLVDVRRRPLPYLVGGGRN